MTLEELLTETKLKVALKIDKKIPPKVLAKIEKTGLSGQELYNLKKTVTVQADSGLSEKDLLRLVDEYMRLANDVHRYGKQLV